MENHERDIESSMSGPENDMSEEEDDDSRISNNSRAEQTIKPSIDPEVLARLKQHGVSFGQEDLERSFPLFFPPHMMASGLEAAASAVRKEDMVHREISPPLRYSADETLPANATPASDSSTSSTSSQQTWSFEEQFKTLYELSDDIKRKEFLDELFSFMQKRGTPINRLPIMAKKMLDLYEVYNLVIARGGLVDVINKKLWPEIIKGLHLPSSTTSAAFTLRRQYMKYLYPYECEEKRLSTPAKLQAAIDRNRRERRRESYVPYPDMISPLSLVRGRPLMNKIDSSHTMHSTSPNSPPNSSSTPYAGEALAALELSRLTFWNLYGGAASGLPDTKDPPQQEALNLEDPTRNSEGAHTPKVLLHSNNVVPTSPRSTIFTPEKENGKRHDYHDHHTNNHDNNHNVPPPPKRMALDEPETLVSRMSSGPDIHDTHIKINSREDGRSGDTSLAVSMEINGIIYQGVLFAQNANATRVV